MFLGITQGFPSPSLTVPSQPPLLASYVTLISKCWSEIKHKFWVASLFFPTVFSLGISCMALDTSSMEVTSKTASSGLTIPQNFGFMCFCHWCLMSISDLIAKICRFSQVWVFHFLPHLSYNNYNNNNNNNSSIHWGCTIFQKLF